MANALHDIRGMSKAQVVAMIGKHVVNALVAHGLANRHALTALESPSCVAVVESYAAMCKTFLETLAGFDGTAESAEAISAASLQYAGAQRVMMPQITSAALQALGARPH